MHAHKNRPPLQIYRSMDQHSLFQNSKKNKKLTEREEKINFCNEEFTVKYFLHVWKAHASLIFPFISCIYMSAEELFVGPCNPEN